MNIQHYLNQQRKNITFNVQKMTQFLYPIELIQKLKNAFSINPPSQVDFNLFNKGRLQILKQNYQHMVLCQTHDQYLLQQNLIDYTYYVAQQMPGSVHLTMFLKCVEIMGNQQQRKRYLKAGASWDVIGCYAQSQIAHGSDVQSLQTTATFIQQTGQIQLHTPTITAAKFWPGDLGLIANHAIVFAQLTMKGKKYGVQPFLIKIRDQNWQCLPGITAGDIGPKMSFQSKQNGYLLFDHFRVPRTTILGRYLQITQNGQLKKLGDPLIAYATMMFIRQIISTASPKVYGQAISVAVRYSLFRKQFKNKSGQQVSIIEYQTQREKLIFRIAQFFAITAGGNTIRKVVSKNSALVEKSDLSYIGETHACLCLGKAFYTQIVLEGMQICRKACGGHGYSHYSGIPNMIGQFIPNVTHQGQNTVLYLQVARYILNNYKKHITQSGKINENAQYITSYDYFMNQNCPQHLANNSQSWRLQDIRKLLAQIVCCSIQKATGKIMNKPEDMNDMEFMGLNVGINLVSLAKAHALYFTFVQFLQAILGQTHEQVRLILIQLCKLFGINQFLLYASPVVQKGLITKQHIGSLIECRQNLISQLRPNIVGLIDSFFIPQHRLRTYLGKGNPYENYLQMARKCQINQKIQQSALIIKQVGKAITAHGQYPKL